jgi:DNA end-binding protein Ku
MFGMAARAIWKGSLKIGSHPVPIKMYAAVQDRDIHFHVLQSTTKSRVKQEMVSEDREQVEKAEIRKGYEVEPGTFVIVEASELQKLKPKESRLINMLRFVSATQLGNEWYERPYYLGPDGDVGSYFALAEALEKRNVVGIARWSMRGKSYVGAVRVEDGYLMMMKLRYSDEVLSADELPAPAGRLLEHKELRMAEELIGALEGHFEPREFRDEYRERLTEFIEAKAKGKHPRLPQIRERRTGGSLDQQLAKSLAAMKRGREKKVA